ncbi:MAG: RidA family protein [Synergistaceae bacterium]
MSSMPIPQGKYKPAVRFGDIIFTSGMTPRENGRLIMSGAIKADSDLENYREAVRTASRNALTAAASLLESGEEIGQILSLHVFINAEKGFLSHAKIGDMASEYFLETIGEGGIGTRAAVGMGTLPGDAPVEIEITAGVKRA